MLWLNCMFDYILNNKPLLVGLHLGFAILGIDGLIWLFGEVLSRSNHRGRTLASSIVGLVGFAMSWLIGGYYYVKFYGPVVKPIIKASNAPWAHAIAMEAKEHIFLFIVPVVFVVLFAGLMDRQALEDAKIRKPLLALIALVALIGLSLGAMGFIISAAARWGGF